MTPTRRRYLAAATAGVLGAFAGCQTVSERLGGDRSSDPTRAATRWLPARDAFAADVGVDYDVVPAATLRAERSSIDDDVFLNMYPEVARFAPVSPEAVDAVVDFAVKRTPGVLLAGSFSTERVGHYLEGQGFERDGEYRGVALYLKRDDENDDVRVALGEDVIVRMGGRSALEARTVLETFVDAGAGERRLRDADSRFAGVFLTPELGHQARAVYPSSGDRHEGLPDRLLDERFRVRRRVADAATVTQTVTFVFPDDESVDGASVRSLVSREDYGNPFARYGDVSVEVDGKTVTATASAENPWAEE